MKKFGISQPVRRLEDQRFITGAGKFVDDTHKPGQRYAGFVRSIIAHGSARLENAEQLRAFEGVDLVATAEDLDAAGVINDLPCTALEPGGTPVEGTERPLLATGTVRYVGEIIAMVVAQSETALHRALDAAEVDYTERDAVVLVRDALAPSAPRVHDKFPGNVGFVWGRGEKEKTQQAIDQAEHQFEYDLINNKVVACAIEPRAALAYMEEGTLVLQTNTQGVWGVRDVIADNCFGGDTSKVRVLTDDVGGGFGMKAIAYPEQVLVPFASLTLQRPVRWVATRQESFLSDSMGRDHVTRLRMGFDKDFRITGFAVHIDAGVGAYYGQIATVIPTVCAHKIFTGVYDITHGYFEARVVLTHSTPVDAYRGAGRPESIYAIERILDEAAAHFGIDRMELRRKNMLTPEQLPYRNPIGEVYDSGDFPALLDTALVRSDAAGFSKRRQEALARGRWRGYGLCYYIESTLGTNVEDSIIDYHSDGTVVIRVGTQSNGQGHETVYAQILHEQLGLELDQVRLEQGNSDTIRTGGGTSGSRSLTIQGISLVRASADLIARAKERAAKIQNCQEEDLTFDPEVSGFRVGNEVVTLAQVAAAGEDTHAIDAHVLTPRAALYGIDQTELEAWTFPNGCHVAEVEIDPLTGATKVVAYTVVDDFGLLVNPLLVEGQVHGGVAQGIGQALMESVVYDDAGQLLSGSFMDYAVPRMSDIPDIAFSTQCVPCTTNILGIKGCGEAGTIGALGSVMNAVHDAINYHATQRVQIDMPATPHRVWEAIQKAGLTIKSAA